jgi:hypothetical protein
MKLLVLAALAAATSSPQQFDLVCSGPVPAGEDTTLWGAPSTHLRVDLATMQWCEDPPQGVVATPCAVLHQIAEVQPGVIWFDKSTDAEDSEYFPFIPIALHCGVWVRRFQWRRGRALTTKEDGCRRRPAAIG